MARLVLLSFKSNEEAVGFAQAMCDTEVKRDVDIADMLLSGGIQLETATVEWVIGQPVNACQCSQTRSQRTRRSNSRRNRKETSGWTKGGKYGWWIHPVKGCGRVSKMVLERFVPNLTNGNYDLLPEILGDPERPPNDFRRYHDIYGE